MLYQMLKIIKTRIKANLCLCKITLRPPSVAQRKIISPKLRSLIISRPNFSKNFFYKTINASAESRRKIVEKKCEMHSKNLLWQLNAITAEHFSACLQPSAHQVCDEFKADDD